MKALCLILALCCAWMPISVGAAEEYGFDQEQGVLTFYRGTGGDVVLPDRVNGQPVRVLGGSLFYLNKDITSAVVPEGVNLIDFNAFYFCEGLERVVLPDSLQAVGAYAFFNCDKLRELHLPGQLSIIDSNAFGGLRGLEKLSFQGPPPLFVGENAFTLSTDAPGVQVTVPGNHLDAYQQLLGVSCQPGPDAEAFYLDVDPAELTFDPGSGSLLGYSGHSAAIRIPEIIDGVAVRALGEKAFFGRVNLAYLALPEGLEQIGDKALYASGLRMLQLPSSLRQIGEDAIAATSKLSRLSLPEGLSQIGKGAFSHSRLEEVNLPEGLQLLPEAAFLGSSWLEDVYLPASLKTIGSQAFKDCTSLEYLVFMGAELPAIAEDAFEGSGNIADVDIAHTASRQQEEAARQQLQALGIMTNVWRANEPDMAPYPGKAVEHDAATALISGYDGSVTELSSYWSVYDADGQKVYLVGVGDAVFKDSLIQRFDMPRSNAFTTIGKSAFENSQLRDIRLFDSLTTIQEAAFRGCKGLKHLVLPDSVKLIGQEAFAHCTGLEQLVLPAEAEIAPDALLGVPLDVLRASPDTSDEQLAAYSSLLGFPWYQGLRRVGEDSQLKAMPDSYVPSPENEFEFDAATGDITKYLGSSAHVVIPRSIAGVPVTGIGFLAFSNLSVYTVLAGKEGETGLVSVAIPETVERIADSAFLQCEALQTVDCWGPVERLGIRAFENCKGLERISFHNSVKTLDIYAFNLCENLHTAELGPLCNTIGEGAFYGCGFEALTLSTPHIGNLAYHGNERLSSITIGASVRDIGEAAFSALPQLTRLCFEGKDANILGEFRYQFSQDAPLKEVLVPADTDDQAFALFQQKLKQNMLSEQLLIRQDCDGEEAGEASTPPTAEEPPEALEPAAEAPETDAEALPAQDAVADVLDRVYTLVEAKAGGYVIEDLAALKAYKVLFRQDGQAQLTVAGSELPAMPWQAEGQTISVDVYGTAYVFQLEDGGLTQDYLGAMTLRYLPE